jgi:hypothetical protein
LLKRGIDDKVVRAVYSQSDLPVDYKGWKKQVRALAVKYSLKAMDLAIWTF